MAAVMAHKGHTVVGVDINPAYVKAIQRRPAAGQRTRPRGDDRGQPRAALRHAESYEEAILATDVTFIIVPTPSDSRRPLLHEVRAQGRGEDRRRAAQEESWHLVVLSSTVMPGSRRRRVAARAGRAFRQAMPGGLRPVLQPRVHRAGQRDARHAEAGHDPDRRIRRALGRASWKNCTPAFATATRGSSA